MDLQKQVTLKSHDPNALPGAEVNERLPLFEAVRRWAEDESLSSLVIEDGEKLLTPADILEIKQSQAYKDFVLAFDDRR